MAIFGRKIRGGADSQHTSGRMDFPHQNQMPAPAKSAPQESGKPKWTGSMDYTSDLGQGHSIRNFVNTYADGSASIRQYQSGMERVGDREQPYNREVGSYQVKEGDWGYDDKKKELAWNTGKGFARQNVTSTTQRDFNPDVERGW